MLGQNHQVLQVLLLQLLTHSLQSVLLPELLLQVLLLQLLNHSLQAARRLVQILVLALVQTDPQSQAPTKTLHHPRSLQPRSTTHPLSAHPLTPQHRRLWLNLIPLTS